MTAFRAWPVAAIVIAALGGCAPVGSVADKSGVSPPVASGVSSSLASPVAVPVVPSIPFSWDATPDTSRVPAAPPDLGPSTGGPPRTDCSDVTVTATGHLDHGHGAITVTLRPGTPLCDIGPVPTKVQLADRSGNVLPVRFVDPTAAITTDPPDYPYVRMGYDGPGTNEVTAVTFKLVWDGSYCGPPPVRLLLYDSSWPGGFTGTPITATLANSSSPCGSQPPAPDSGADAGTIAVYPARGYPLPAPEWAMLHASIRSIDSTSAPPSFVVRLTNPTDQSVPLRPCFSYSFGIVADGTDGSHTGEAFDGNPDCTKMPATLPPGGSVDLPVNPTDVDPNATTGLINAT